MNMMVDALVPVEFSYKVIGPCDGCRLCAYLAVENFALVPGSRRYQVVRQPEGWEEREQCQEAFERCPYGGIERQPLKPL